MVHGRNPFSNQVNSLKGVAIAEPIDVEIVVIPSQIRSIHSDDVEIENWSSEGTS